MYKAFIVLFFILLVIFFVFQSANAQTNQFTYQGSLKDGANAASGNYDITVEIYDAETGGTLIKTSSFTNVSVVNGVFTLNIGADVSVFPGATRYVQLKVKRSGTIDFVTMSPRQLVTSSPYSLKSQNAETANTANTANSAGTADNAQQLGGVNANQFVQTTDSRLSDSRPPTAGSSNYIQNSASPQANSSFNISGNGVIGGNAGVGTNSPQYKLHVVGRDIRVEGNTTSTFPRFSWNFTGGEIHEKKWQVYAATRSLNFSALSDEESFEQIWLRVNRSNFNNIGTIIFPLGFVGIGITPQAKLHVFEETNLRPALRAEVAFLGGRVASFGSLGEFQIDATGVTAGRFVVKDNGNVGIGWTNPSGKLDVNGDIRFSALGQGGTSNLCYNSSGQISSCSSSLRYKTNIANLNSGLNLINRLRPVTFDWKESKERDLGLVAEEVAEVEPLLTIRNAKGEIEGVKYDRLSVVFINAFKEQQTQIEAQQKQLDVQAKQIERLKQLVCSQNPGSAVCKEDK